LLDLGDLTTLPTGLFETENILHLSEILLSANQQNLRASAHTLVVIILSLKTAVLKSHYLFGTTIQSGEKKL